MGDGYREHLSDLVQIYGLSMTKIKAVIMLRQFVNVICNSSINKEMDKCTNI